MKRVYPLAAIGALALVIGPALIYEAGGPLSKSEDLLIPTAGYQQMEFGLLEAGLVRGNFSERQGRSLEFFVFDDRGYSSFLGSSDLVPPLFTQSGANVRFEVNLAGLGQYHLVFVDSSGQGGLQIHLDVLVIGRKTSGTLLGTLILVSGAALFPISWRFGRVSPRPSPPAPPPAPSVVAAPPSLSPRSAQPHPQEPPDDGTRVY